MAKSSAKKRKKQKTPIKSPDPEAVNKILIISHGLAYMDRQFAGAAQMCSASRSFRKRVRRSR